MKFALLLLIASLFVGCATILNDETQNLNVTTTNNAKISGTIDGIPFSAPGIVTVKRAKLDKVIVVSEPACTTNTLLVSSVDNKFFINILSGGTFGSSTDYGTEEMWKYQDSVMIPCK